MKLMFLLRPQTPTSKLPPESNFIRNIQAPDQIVLDEKTDLFRFSSAAFGPSTSDRKLSGNLEHLIVEDGFDPKTFPPAAHVNVVGAAALCISVIENSELNVSHEKTVGNWYHGNVGGYAATASQRDKQRRALAKLATIYVPIDQVAARKRYEEQRQSKLRSADLRSTQDG